LEQILRLLQTTQNLDLGKDAISVGRLIGIENAQKLLLLKHHGLQWMEEKTKVMQR
jgi:hypothetical protein